MSHEPSNAAGDEVSIDDLRGIPRAAYERMQGMRGACEAIRALASNMEGDDTEGSELTKRDVEVINEFVDMAIRLIAEGMRDTVKHLRAQREPKGAQADG